ncbi:MAG: hypothetical protein Q9162_004514 [Coniocarpon cinnabarinum]
MPKPGGTVPIEKRNTIVRLLFHRCRHAEIAQEMDVGLGLVKKIERNLLDYGTPDKPDPPKKGRPPQIKPEIAAEMLEVWETTGFDIGQKQLCQWIENKHGIKVSQSSVSRVIKQSGRKKAVAVVAYAEKLKERARQENDEQTATGDPPTSLAMQNTGSQSSNSTSYGASSSNTATSNVLQYDGSAHIPPLDPDLAST